MSDVPRATGEAEHHIWRRLWRYQAERFPLLSNGIVIALFAASAVGVAPLLTASPAPAEVVSFAVAIIVALIAFLHLRIADEFKDREIDRRWRPERPVPRGLVRLDELALLGVFAALAQGIAVLLFDISLFAPLFLIWGYFALMSTEFFVGPWLRRHPLAYLLSHMPIVPLIALFCIACHWHLAGGGIDILELVLFLGLCGAGSIVFEIGRKIRAPADERSGVETYTALWGVPRALAAWLMACMAAYVCCVGLAMRLGIVLPALIIAAVLTIVAVVLALRFLQTPRHSLASAVERLSALKSAALPLTVGVVPWLVAP